MTPGFYSLFRRSRFARRDLSLEGQEQRERFAVSLLGWALRYEPSFALYFLTHVCDFKRHADFRIEIEPEDWGDLVLSSQRESICFVIEFKLGPELGRHQNPFEGEAFWRRRSNPEQKDGYGWQLKNFFKDRRINTIVFITLTSEPVAKRPIRRKGIKCHSKTWRNLAEFKPDSEPLRDL